MNDMLKMGIILMVVTLIASLALSVTNYYTEPLIEKQSGLAVKGAFNNVISTESFQEKDGYYEAYDKDGKLIGYVTKVEAPGYSSIINALVGVDIEGKITGVDVISQQETPGLGANVEKESFLKQFIGKTVNGLKVKKDGGEIDSITGATISSRAITEGIRNSIEKNILEMNITEGSNTISAPEKEDGEEIDDQENNIEEKDYDFEGSEEEEDDE